MLPVVEHAAFVHDDVGPGDWLAALARYGFVLLRDGPAAPGEVVRAAERVGWPRGRGRH